MNERTAYLWLLTTALADISTTAVGIKVFGLVEANGIPALAMDTFGVGAFVPMKAVVAGLVFFEYLWIREHRGRLERYLGGALVVIVGLLSAVPALWNLHLILSV